MNNKIYYERPKNLQNKTNHTPKSVNYVRDNGPYMSRETQEQQYYQPSYKAPVYEEHRPVLVKNTPIKEAIANLLLILLSIVLVISLGALISELRIVNRKYTREAQDFWRAIEYENYSDMVTMKWNNEAIGVHKNAELKQCYAVADYFEAASLYKAAAFEKNTEDMQKYETRMNEAYRLLDDVSYVAGEIDAYFGLETAR